MIREELEKFVEDDGRFDIRAVKFVYEGLGYTAKKMADRPDHVSGQILCEGLKKLSLEKYGMLAKLVLNSWRINSTRDFGEIVYFMIKHQWMSAQPSDSIEDFDDVYDFESTFVANFKF